VPSGAIVVIGAANGIGAATAVRLARAGAALVLADAEAGALHRLAGAIRDAGGRALAYPMDVRDPVALAGLLDAAAGAYGAVGSVINCAAVLHPAEIVESTVDGIREQVEVNLTGTMLVARAFVPYFRSRGAGRLLAVASLGGLAPMPGESVYCATKFGVRGFCQALALELRGTGVTVCCVCPDSADTRQLRTEAQHDASTMSFTSPPMDADDVARAIVRTLVRPRREVLVPGPRGALVRLLTWSPGFFALLYPLLDRLGRRGQSRYRERIAAAALAPPGTVAP
jgi:short-subunit dehydrogenase